MKVAHESRHNFAKPLSTERVYHTTNCTALAPLIRGDIEAEALPAFMDAKIRNANLTANQRCVHGAHFLIIALVCCVTQTAWSPVNAN